MKHFLNLFFALLFCTATLTAQLNLTEDFEHGQPGWSLDGSVALTEYACTGSSLQSTLYVYLDLDGGPDFTVPLVSVTSPEIPNATADEVTITWDYKTLDIFGAVAPPDFGFIELSYSTNGGSFTPIWLTSTPVANCTTQSVTIPSGTLTAGDNVTFRYTYVLGLDNRNEGEWSGYLDNFSATQPGACMRANAGYSVVPNCDASGTESFNVSVDITDLGAASVLTVSDNQGNAPQVVSNTGLLTFGPYANNTNVVISIVPDSGDPALCTATSQTLTQAYCPATNVSCTTATPLVCGEGVLTQTTLGASSEPSFTCGNFPDGLGGGFGGGPAVWYSFEGKGLEVTISVNRAEGPPPSLFITTTCFPGINDPCVLLSSGVPFTADDGVTYYIVVAESGGTMPAEAFTIEMTTICPPPVNDACDGAIALTPGEDTYTTTNYAFATGNDKPEVENCPGNSSVGNGVWFSFTGDGDDVNITVDDGSGFAYDAEINVFTGPCDNLTCTDHVDDPEDLTIATTLGTEYRIYVGPWTSNNSPLGELTITAAFASPLPVELASFTGRSLDKVNQLNWVTATEDGADRYVVERSAVGSRNWEAIGEVLAVGNSTDEVGYGFIDEAPLSTAFYRLKTVDLDGRFEYSEIVSLTNNRQLSGKLAVSPVPTSGNVTVGFQAINNGEAVLSLTDMNGRTISQRSLNVTEGYQTQNIDLSKVTTGIYLLRVNVDGRQLVQRVVRR